MNSHSIRFRLSLLVATLFVASNALILVLLGDELYKIADSSQKLHFEDRLSLIANDLQRRQARLQATLQVDAYEPEFKAAAIAQFKQSHYQNPAYPAYPMIVDGDGVIVAHPMEPTGSKRYAAKDFVKAALAVDAGDFLSPDGTDPATWYVTETFAPWGWRIIYSVPLNIKYADANRISQLLFWIMLGASLIAVSLIFYVMNRITRPIVELSQRTQEITKGKWNQTVKIDSSDEIGVLAENFNAMQAAIHEKIAELDTHLKAQREEIVRRQQVEEKLRASETRLTLATDVAGMGIFDFDMVADVLLWDDLMLKIHGISREAFGGNHAAWQKLVHPDDLPRLMRERRQRTVEDRAYFNEFRIVTPAGDVRYIEAYALLYFDAQGAPVHMLGVNRDVTERRTTEDFVKRSQKMEALGQITGGVAHDFNNILGIILGNLEIIASDLDDASGLKTRVKTAIKSTLRAADLTKDLLNFSRSEANNPVEADINTIIRNMTAIVMRSVTPQVEVDYHLAGDLWLTDIDIGDFEDALLNMILNARDAMQGVGKLTIETTNKALDAQYCKANPSILPGDYVQLAVSDTGSGIPTEIMERIFDPFFTTKPKGKGTGLGLSMIFGFAKRSHGHVKAYSEPGVGTTFRLYLPRSNGLAATAEHARPVKADLPKGNETILVVDDEEGLLEIAQIYLGTLGYTTLSATNGHDALALLQNDASIDLLFSDVVMPGGINGYELAEQAVKLHPKLKILLTSGFTGKAMARNGQARFSAHLLNKPYNEADLALYLRATLDETD